jgi:hypothetical protein
MEDLGLRYEVEATARAFALPDAWGKTFQQRAGGHFLTFQQRVLAQMGTIQRTVSEAESVIARLTREIDRESFKRVMRQVEGARAAMMDNVLARNNFDRATRVIRKWALNNPGEPIPPRLIDGLRVALDAGWKMSLKDGLMRRATVLRDNLVSLTRNFSNRIFQGATLYFARGFSGRGVRAVRWLLSPAHRVIDMCDILAIEDMGLGPGVYYIDYVPSSHINCLCTLEPVYGETALPPNQIQLSLQDLIERAEDANP